MEREKLRFQIDKIFPLEVQKLEAEIERIQNEKLLIDAQIRKIDQEILNLQENILHSQEERDKMIAEQALMVKQGELIDQQILKAIAEIDLIQAKTATENANTIDHGPGGLIGKQKDLLTAQKLGFAGDLYMKSAKMYADYTNTVIAIYEPITESGDEFNLDPGATGAASSAETIAGTIAGI